MGFLGRLFGRDQRAMPDPGSPEFQQAVEGSALPGSTEMGQAGWASAGQAQAGGEPVRYPGMPEPQAGMPVTAVTPEALMAAGVPRESAEATAAALTQLQQAFGGGAMNVGDVTVEAGQTHTLDLQGMTGLKEQMEAAMREHGVDPQSGEPIDASSVPGLQEAMLRVLAENGVDVSDYR